MGIDPSFIEKDWFLTQVIAALTSLRHEGFEFIFTGGTALSKAHKLIQRFSEDIDFRVIAPPEQQSRKPLSRFKKTVLAHLLKAGFEIEAHQVEARDDTIGILLLLSITQLISLLLLHYDRMSR